LKQNEDLSVKVFFVFVLVCSGNVNNCKLTVDRGLPSFSMTSVYHEETAHEHTSHTIYTTAYLTCLHSNSNKMWSDWRLHRLWI